MEKNGKLFMLHPNTYVDIILSYPQIDHMAVEKKFVVKVTNLDLWPYIPKMSKPLFL